MFLLVLPNKCVVNNKADYYLTTLNLKKISLDSYYCQTRIIWNVYMSKYTKKYCLKKNRQSAEIKAKFINEHRWLKAKDYSKLEWNNPIFENINENEN